MSIDGIVITEPYIVDNNNIKLTQFVIANREQHLSVIIKGIYNVGKFDVVSVSGTPRTCSRNGIEINEIIAQNLIC